MQVSAYLVRTINWGKLWKLHLTYFVYCKSGGRSGQATGFLQAQGIECYNGGGWMELNYAVSQSA